MANVPWYLKRPINKVIGIVLQSGLNNYYTDMTAFLNRLKHNWHNTGDSVEHGAMDLDFLWQSIGCGLLLSAIVFWLELLGHAISMDRWRCW